MEIRDSALRHGIADSDIQHASDNAVAAGPVETNVDQIDGVSEVAIHAMRLRKAYERYLPREGRP